MELVEVADEAEATRLGMCGSPTILIDGTDPFPPPGAVPSLSCRLAACPFSAVPTRHRVRLGSGVEVWSMCAIDALGIPAMLGQDAVISSTDPVSGDAVTVTSADGVLRWDPVDAVVFVGQRPGGGPAAAACCDALNFFTGAANAGAWTSRHPDVPGRTVGRSEAERVGRETFGHLLAP
ncbi:alkylmercury lyase family protein [Kitasatospora sp. NPDC091335]|uniref:alkylmercury lyase family protein n=1 Tax=Kitasatospora sp. NPDC091335 TaxID=3364085 RepID=UPI0037F46EAF